VSAASANQIGQTRAIERERRDETNRVSNQRGFDLMME
jgi:hypothetical protein